MLQNSGAIGTAAVPLAEPNSNPSLTKTAKTFRSEWQERPPLSSEAASLRDCCWQFRMCFWFSRRAAQSSVTFFSAKQATASAATDMSKGSTETVWLMELLLYLYDIYCSMSLHGLSPVAIYIWICFENNGYAVFYNPPALSHSDSYDQRAELRFETWQQGAQHTKRPIACQPC